MGKPSTDGPNGRDKKSGKFTAGNRFGKGNPYGRRVKKWRMVAIASATDEMIQEVIASLHGEATKGNVPAAKLYLDVTLGLAKIMDEDIRVNELEATVEQLIEERT